MFRGRVIDWFLSTQCWLKGTLMKSPVKVSAEVEFLLAEKTARNCHGIVTRTLNPSMFSDVTAGTNCISGHSICKRTNVHSGWKIVLTIFLWRETFLTLVCTTNSCSASHQVFFLWSLVFGVFTNLWPNLLNQDIFLLKCFLNIVLKNCFCYSPENISSHNHYPVLPPFNASMRNRFYRHIVQCVHMYFNCRHHSQQTMFFILYGIHFNLLILCQIWSQVSPSKAHGAVNMLTF